MGGMENFLFRFNEPTLLPLSFHNEFRIDLRKILGQDQFADIVHHAGGESLLA